MPRPTLKDRKTIEDIMANIGKLKRIAKLLARMESHTDYEVWMVKFLSDGYMCPRRIQKPR